MINNLKKIRTEKGFTLEKLAEMCGKSKSALWELEQDNTEPRLNTAYIISKVLDVGIFDIWPDCNEVVEETVVIRRVSKEKAPKAIGGGYHAGAKPIDWII